MRFLLLLASLLSFLSAISQQSSIPKHTYKVRIRTMDNTLHRGIITAINDTSVTLLWHGDATRFRYTDISRITVFRKGTAGKLMLATVPLSIAGGLAISRNQPTPNNATRWLNNFAGVTIGFAAGVVEAGFAGRLLRKQYKIAGERTTFQLFVSRIIVRELF